MAKSTKKTQRNKKAELKMDFISMTNLEGDSVDKKIGKILQIVKKGHIVVLDRALNNEEEVHLVTETMEGIKGDFKGIEFCSLPTPVHKVYEVINTVLEKVFRQKLERPGLTVVGPSTVIQQIKRDPNAFYVYARLEV